MENLQIYKTLKNENDKMIPKITNIVEEKY